MESKVWGVNAMYRDGNGQPYGLVTNIQKYTIHDGPGIRTEIFFKGCNMHCLWCSNPETIDPRQQIGVYPKKCVGCGSCVEVCPQGGAPIVFGPEGLEAVRMNDACRACLKCADECPGRAIMVWGDRMTVPELMKIIREDRSFYEKSGGGVTLSGGEVLMQWEFARELLKACQAEGIHTCVESALNFPPEPVDGVMEYTDLLIADIKHMDSKKHEEATGLGNQRVLDNLKRLAGQGKPMVLRTPVIPDYNDSEEAIAAIGAFIQKELGGKVVQYQLLPYRKMGTEKHAALGQHYPMGDDYVPPEREVWEENLTRLVAMLQERFGLPAVAGSGQKLEL